MDLSEPSVYQRRRDKLCNIIKEGLILVSAAPSVVKSHDTEYPFRQDSNFRYLTGFHEPKSILALKVEQDQYKSILFLREKDETMEMWMGKVLGVAAAPERLDIDEAYSIDSFSEKLPELMFGHSKIFYDLSSPLASTILQGFNKVQKARKKKVTKPSSFHHLTPILGHMRLIKDEQEIQSMKKGMELTSHAHQYAMGVSKEGLNESQISNALNYVFHGSLGEGPAYDNIVAAGANALTLHYINNDQDLKDGDLVLIDAGAQYHGYATDISRTYPVSGRFTEAQKTVYQLVLDAQKASLTMAKPGSNLRLMHEEACKVLVQGLIDHGVLKGTLEEELEKADYRKYYPHGTGHWLGLDVHDTSPYLDEDNQEITFEPGMVMTCEPGLYFPVSDDQIPTSWQGIGIRIEDDILITKHGHENLSAMIPKEIKEVEDACSQDYSLPQL